MTAPPAANGAARVIDFRVRPPSPPFARLKIFRRLEKGQGPLVWHGALPPSITERSMDLFYAEMDAGNVQHGVVWGRAVNDPDESTSIEDIAEIVRGSDGKLSGLGGVAIPGAGDVGRALDDTEKAVCECGLLGITLEPGYSFSDTFGADDPRLYPLYQRCQDLGAIIGFTIAVRAGPNLRFSMPMALDRVAGDFPDLKMVVSHAFWPWVTESCGLAYRRPNVYLHPDFYGIDFPGYMGWVEAANTFLSERLIYGSAYPLIGMGAALDGYAALPYRDDVRERVMYGNAARLLRLDR